MSPEHSAQPGAEAAPQRGHGQFRVAVIESAVRRHRRRELPELDAALAVGELTIRPDLYQAYVGESSVELTAREFEILQLLSQADRVLRREEIYERVWGYAMAHGDRSVDVFVRKLRQKLDAASPAWRYIHTHFGIGYRFDPETTAEEAEPDPRQAPSAFSIACFACSGVMSPATRIFRLAPAMIA